jgi:steroid delta-isomerase
MAPRKLATSKGNLRTPSDPPKPSCIDGGHEKKMSYFKQLTTLVEASGPFCLLERHRSRPTAPPVRAAPPRRRRCSGGALPFIRWSVTTCRMQALVDARVEAAVNEYFRTISARDKSAWLALFDKAGVVHEPVGATPAEGREGFEQVWQVFTGPFATLSFETDEVFYSGSGAAARWSARASATTGSSADFAGITVFEVDQDGRIQTVMSYWDPAAVLIQLAGAGDDEEFVVDDD